jgi:hypothetical protein
VRKTGYWAKRAVNILSFGKWFKQYSLTYCFDCRKLVHPNHQAKREGHRVVSFGWRKDPRDPRDLLWRRLFKVPRILPERVDLRDRAGPVRNQLNEGSCVGFAAMALKNWWEKAQKDYPGKQGGISPRCCYNGAKWIGGYLSQEGAYLRDALKFLKKYGTCTEAEWPYVPVADRTVSPLDRVKPEQLEPWKIVSYVRLGSVDEVLHALASESPVFIGTPWFRNWLNVGRDGKLPPADGKVVGGHATLLLGYDMKEHRFIGQNSWGTQWGDRGFYYMLMSDVEGYFAESDFWTVVDLEPSPPGPQPKPDSKICEYVETAQKWLNMLHQAICESYSQARYTWWFQLGDYAPFSGRWGKRGPGK